MAGNRVNFTFTCKETTGVTILSTASIDTSSNRKTLLSFGSFKLHLSQEFRVCIVVSVFTILQSSGDSFSFWNTRL